jgi:release factor glutamine methyltransferase
MTATRFHGLTLLTHPGHVMTPRPATEALVDEALRWLDGPAQIADVGTGSGAVAVALAQAAPEAEIWATDVSPAAAALARANVQSHGLSDRVHVRQGDLLGPVPPELDLIVANLPYLPQPHRALYPDLVDEPVAAVFAGGDGLGPYRRLLAAGADRLAPDGALVLQIHRTIVAGSRNELASVSEEVERIAAEQTPALAVA